MHTLPTIYEAMRSASETTDSSMMSRSTSATGRYVLSNAHAKEAIYRIEKRIDALMYDA